jgi:hypothetical protein
MPKGSKKAKRPQLVCEAKISLSENNPLFYLNGRCIFAIDNIISFSKSHKIKIGN